MAASETALATALALVLAGCLEVPKPPPKDAVDAEDVETSPEVKLSDACTPTGVELCFDALDNNCNGIIDEGCGLQTGLLQFTIAWHAPSADVDLDVTGPGGEVAHLEQPNASGLLKDRDCPGSENRCYGQNVENVFLAEGRPKRGRYQVVIRLTKLHDASTPISVTLSARIGQRLVSSTVELEEEEQEHELAFTL